MSFGRLLAAGKSLIGMRSGVTRYRENKHVRLPKFISPKNPFASERPIGSDSHVGTAPPVSVPGAPNQTVSPTPTVGSARNGATRKGWLETMNQKFSTLWTTPNKSVFRRGTASASLQGELALESVRVMRNDLLDADRAPGLKATRALGDLPVMAATLEKLEPVSAAWSRLTAKFLGSDQT